MGRTIRSAGFFIAITIGLAGCEDGINGILNSPEDAAEAAPAQVSEARTGVRDVERPDVFSVEDRALWDGRPSLGGIWVAHADVKEPERVVMVNTETGQRVAGALFRRERDNPGPPLQLSSDAASALNILAGQPTRVSVVAVRQEEFEVEAPAPVISDETAEGAPSIDEDPVVTEDSTVAAATVDDLESADGADNDAAVAGAGISAAAAATPTPRKPNFFDRIFGQREPGPVIEDITPPQGDPTALNASVPAVETQPIDPVASSAAAAIARAEADNVPAPRPAAAERTAPANVRNPFVQVGLYSVKANAETTANNLRQAGIVPRLVAGRNDNGEFWRVIAGPVTTADDQARLLARVKQLGYSDAYLSPN